MTTDRRPLRRLAALLAMLGIWALAGCGGAPAPAGDVTVVDPDDEVLDFGPVDTAYVDSAYRLGPGDQVKLVFMFDHELDDEIIVRPDGAINLPILGDIKVAGETPGDLARRVQDAYSRYYTNPQLSINLTKFAPPQCYVMGEVRYPRAVEIRPGMTVAAALVEAGGSTDASDLRHTVLVRRVAHNRAVARRFDVLRFAEGRDLSSDIYLRDYDIVYVPKTFLGRLNTIVEQLFGKMSMLPVFYLRGWEAFNTGLVYNRTIRPSEIPTSSSSAPGARRTGGF